MSGNTDARDSGEIEYRSYTGDPDDWSIDDPRVGPGVPLSVRRAGCTGPDVREEIGGNGVSIRGHAAPYECLTCGEVRRFVTSDVQTQYRCESCGTVRWFEVKEVDHHAE